jgi:nickel transport protein
MRPAKKLRLLLKVAVAIVFALMLMSSFMVTRASAHKVNVFAWVEGDTVFVEGYFPGGKKAQNSLIQVFDKPGVKLLEGRTNEKGEFSFKTPAKTDLRIVLTTSMGHKNDFIVPATGFGEASSPQSGPFAQLQQSNDVSVPVSSDQRQLEEMIDKTLDRKLAPVIKLIRDTRREGPTFTEIVGGIGYIFGLVGVFMYFKNRKKGTRHTAQGARQNEKGGTNG